MLLLRNSTVGATSEWKWDSSTYNPARLLARHITPANKLTAPDEAPRSVVTASQQPNKPRTGKFKEIPMKKLSCKLFALTFTAAIAGLAMAQNDGDRATLNQVSSYHQWTIINAA